MHSDLLLKNQELDVTSTSAVYVQYGDSHKKLGIFSQKYEKNVLNQPSVCLGCPNQHFFFILLSSGINSFLCKIFSISTNLIQNPSFAFWGFI